MGLCPRCLLQSHGDTAQPPPGVAEIAPFFPQLDGLELLGHGGMGAVYKARQRELDRLVAVKILPIRPGETRRVAFEARFTREARALARLNHPNIVTLYDFGEVDGLFYIFMEYVEGVNLRELMNRGGVGAREALAIVPQICAGLHYAHEQGIIHRDIKPENILVRRDGVVKIADFGIARLVLGEEPLQAQAGGAGFTEAGGILGTPDYMAPEQKKDSAGIDHRADIYSLGVVFYQMLTGKMPEEPLKLSSIILDVRIEEIVLRALEKTPERRYAHVGQLQTALETVAQTPEPRVLRRWWIGAGIAVGVVAGVVALGIGVWLMPRGEAETPGAAVAPVAVSQEELGNEVKAWPNHLFSYNGREVDLDGIRSALAMLWVKQLKDRRPVRLSMSAARGGEEGVEDLKEIVIQSGVNAPETFRGKTTLDKGDGRVDARFQIHVEAESHEKGEALPSATGEMVNVTPQIWLTEDDIAAVTKSQEEGDVMLHLTPLGIRRFAYLASRFLKRRLAIVLDGTVISSPTIQVEMAPSTVTLSFKENPTAREAMLHLLDKGGALESGSSMEYYFIGEGR